jgi:hypothetical protein
MPKTRYGIDAMAFSNILGYMTRTKVTNRTIAIAILLVGVQVFGGSNSKSKKIPKEKIFALKPIEVVLPTYFTANVQNSGEEQANPIFDQLPHYKDNEFDAQRKKAVMKEKWLGRQFLVIMGENDFKDSREIIKSTEPDIYTNATLLGVFDFKRKIYPLKVESGCIDIGTDYKESAKYESFGQQRFFRTNITHQICLKSLLEMDFSSEQNKLPDYYISLPENEAENLKNNFASTQIGIVLAWLPDDTVEVKGEVLDWGKVEYNGKLESETFDRLEPKLTAISVLILHKEKIYQTSAWLLMG